LHFPEQQLPSDVQDAPDGLHAQAAAAWQLVSEQSVAPSQSLSTPSEHMPGADSLTGGGPQSLEQVQRSSLALHMPSPQKGGGPQSISQLKPLSLPPHTASPQQNAEADALLHREPPEVHRASLHETEFAPPPLPQQKRSDGFPFCLPRQSLGQETQFAAHDATVVRHIGIGLARIVQIVARLVLRLLGCLHAAARLGIWVAAFWAMHVAVGWIIHCGF
jgi:hypothetical protein